MTNNIRIFDLDKNEIDIHPKTVSLGNFDGIHKGHRKLMKKNIELSNQYDLTPSVLLFKENTKNILNGEREYLTSLEDKIEILADLGIKCFCLLDFNEKFKNLSPEDFIEKILYEKLNAKYVIIGDNYFFGKGAIGDKNTLKAHEDEYDYKTYVVDFEMDEDRIINSTDIRKMIRKGDLAKANRELERPYRMKGTIVKGKQRGRLLNFPTANLNPNFKYVSPKFGVYFSKVYLDNNTYFALTDVGTNPTFENEKIKIETYILDFSEDVYGKEMTIEYLEYLRPDYKFDSKDGLIEQMNEDKKLAYRLKEKYKKA
ncbi:MAG: bifunctional riboflavin kinase/FAD synthetase [Peptoniphilaceae bacterium]|nr:bifunctional riboflavin kinase/FAD synthetase [Peptoniphilaceae bacterium]MDY6019062.1 bifunctional riboflavin kinase/FAD synthetase [Anaerococcus sp.]